MSDEQSQPEKQPENQTPLTEQPKEQKTGQLIDAGMDFAKKRAEIESQRKKPGEETLEQQQAAAKAAFEQSIEEELRAMEAEEEAETGEDINEEEISEMRDTIHEVFESMSPAFGAYLKGLKPRLSHLIDETNQLREDGNDKDAIDKLTKFLEDEDAYIGKNITDEKLKNILQGYIRAALNADQIVKDMQSQTWKEIKSDVVDLVPVIGPVKMLTEAAKGKTAGGETLEGKGRAWHAAKATGSLVIDGVAVVGLLSGGTVSAAVEGGKAAAASGKVATIASRFGAEGVEVAASVKKFAALTRKTTKMTGTARKIYKCGVMMGKYPKLSYSIVKLIDKREDLEKLYKKGKANRKFTKNYRQKAEIPAMQPANNNNLPEAPSKAA